MRKNIGIDEKKKAAVVLKLVLLVAISLMVRLAVLPHFTVRGAQADVFLLVIGYIALSFGLRPAIICALVGGLMTDALLLGRIGPYMLLYTLAAAVMYAFRPWVMKDHIVGRAIGVSMLIFAVREGGSLLIAYFSNTSAVLDQTAFICVGIACAMQLVFTALWYFVLWLPKIHRWQNSWEATRRYGHISRRGGLQ